MICSASAGQTAPAIPSSSTASNVQSSPAKPASDSRLTNEGKLDIVRDVDGEYAKVVQPLPSVKPGFRLSPGKAVDQQALESALIRSAPAANPGDTVQITNIKFGSKEIQVEINGGSNPHESWRQRIHIQASGPFPTSQVVKDQPPGLAKLGSTLIVDFGRPVPNLTPAELKHYLAPFLNFAGERSAAMNWVQTLDPKFQKAIQAHTAIAGMDRDMVIAALGRADHKVREFTPDGTETEDWIYGRPPGTTIFVTFIGESVVKVRSFP
ncbi:MAG: hypothetical protein KGL59_08900 [Acidobacteriota bacterium]|nr:hypothetical protein [Acidobacteriota bacterium]